MGKHHAEVLQAGGEVGETRVRSGFCQAPPDLDGLLASCQCLLAASELVEPAREIAYAHREIGEVGVGLGFSKATVDVDGVLASCQRFLAAPEVVKRAKEI